MNTLLKKLKTLVEIERRAEMDKQEREMKTLSGKERELKGRAILGLRGKVIGKELGFSLVKLGRGSELITEIAVGDEVLISRGNPLREGFVGTVTATGSRFLIVAVNEIPSFPLTALRVDLYIDDITYRRMKDVLDNPTKQGKKVLRFFKGDMMPTDSVREKVFFIDDELNEAQKEAVSLAMGSDDFFLIHGPFGTGKTKTLHEIILQEIKRGNKVLATAESNIAVDNLMEGLFGSVNIVRIGHPARVSDHLTEKTLSYLVENSKNYSAVKKLREEGEKLIKEQKRYKKPIPSSRRGMSNEEIKRLDYLKKEKRGVSKQNISSMARWISLKERADSYFHGMRAMEEKIASRIVEKAEVVLSTNSSAAMDLLDEVSFDVIVADEASQTILPSALIPLSKCTRFILAGDYKQLPPTITSREAKDLGITLFEVLINKYPILSNILNTQYRMNKLLMEFPSTEFYKGKIKPSSSVEKIRLSDLGIEEKSSPLLFVDTISSSLRYESQKKDSPSYYNKLEGELVEKITLQLYEKGLKKKNLGIITPYEDQVEFLRKKIDAQVNTVDGYQGQEREVIILSLVRSNRYKKIGFLKDMRRLNVSLTRAKRKLIIIGDSSTLSSHPTFKKLFRLIKEKGAYLSCDEKIVV